MTQQFVEVPKVSIRDSDALAALSFAMVAAYLRETGWKYTGQLGEREIAIYEKGGTEVIVGQNEQFADRRARIAEAIEFLAEIEGRSELLVYWDIISLHQKQQGGKSIAFVAVVPGDALVECMRLIDVQIEVMSHSGCEDEKHADESNFWNCMSVFLGRLVWSKPGQYPEPYDEWREAARKSDGWQQRDC